MFISLSLSPEAPLLMLEEDIRVCALASHCACLSDVVRVDVFYSRHCCGETCFSRPILVQRFLIDIVFVLIMSIICDMSEGEEHSKANRLKAPVGRLVDSNQADDRKMIGLVKERPLLFARCNMPIASYYRQVKLLWKEVADEMGCGVAEVRRKWSHIRNSYSRHLRNELSGARTVKGRAVSRWYLADELEFLKQHMATDRRSSGYSWISVPERSVNVDAVDMNPFLGPNWYSVPQNPVKLEPDHDDSSNSQSHAADLDENSAYFQFFKSIFNDYNQLVPKKQRLFRRQCLNYLHELLDGSEQSSSPGSYQHAINLSSSAECAREVTDSNMCVLTKIESCENVST